MFKRCATLALAITVATMSAGPVAAFDLQGHRGARGLAPENTLAGFARALEIGVTTLELDLAVTKDGVLVVTHDPTLNPNIVRTPDGRWLAARGPAVYSLTLEELKRYDVGRIRPWTSYWLRFRGQTPADGERIPTLEELFGMVKASGKAPRFNIETKLSPERPSETPDPETFAKLLVDAVRDAGLADRTSIQSFDWRTLLASKKLGPEIETVCLTSNAYFGGNLRRRGGQAASPWLGGLDPAAYGGSVPRLVKAAGCGTWSPRKRDLSGRAVAEAHALGLKVVPWTVNAKGDVARALALKVDGLITDYPSRVREMVKGNGIALP